MAKDWRAKIAAVKRAMELDQRRMRTQVLRQNVADQIRKLKDVQVRVLITLAEAKTTVASIRKRQSDRQT